MSKPHLPHAAMTARNAQQELNQLRKALHQAQDDLSGLHRMLKVAVPKGGRRSTRASSAKLSLLDKAGQASLNTILGATGRGVGRDLVAGGDSFYTSAAQSSSDLISFLQFGQRIL